MQRRLFLSGFSAAAGLALVGCGGGGSSAAGATDGAVASVVTGGAAAAGTNAATASPASPPTGTPSQTSATLAASTLPAKVLACYYTCWDAASLRITDVPAQFNVVYLFHAKPAGNPVNGSWNNVGDGSFQFEYFDTVLASDIQKVRSRGQRVVLTVGGAAAGFNFDTRAKSQNFVNSFRSIHDRLGGVDGCDFNNFEANIGSSATEMVWIAQQLKALYGQDFIISAPPQPFSDADLAMMKAMADAGVLDWAAPQFYDWSGFNTPGTIAGKTRDWVAALGAGKVMVGLSANYGNGPALGDCTREYAAVKAAAPGIRGTFCWNALLNVQGGNVWGQTMQAML